MRHGLSGLDHLIIGVRGLEQARAQWQRLGFTLTPRGRHKGWGTANYCIMFAEGYLELLGIVDAAQFTNNLDKFLDRREGLMSVALASPDAAATQASLVAAGVAADGPHDLARYLELPEGDVEPAFKLVHLPADATPGVPCFVTEHLTPALIRRPVWEAHPNGVVGIRSIGLVVADPGAYHDAYVRLLGPGAVTATDDVIAVHFGDSTLLFASPDDFDLFTPDMDHAYDPPQMLSLGLLSQDLSATAAALADGGVPCQRQADGSLIVRPADANGVIVEFMQA